MRAPTLNFVVLTLSTWVISSGTPLLSGCGSGVEGALGDGSTNDTTDATDTSVNEDGTEPDADETDGSDAETDRDTTVPVDGDTRTDTEVTPGQPTVVEIVAPLDGDSVRDTIPIRLIAVGRDERPVDTVTLKVNGFQVFSDVKLPTEFLLDTRAHPAAELVLEAFAKDGFTSGTHTITVTPNNPPIGFLEVTPREPTIKNGEVLSVEVRLSGPPELNLTADLSAIDSGYQPGLETAYPLGANTYALTYIMSRTNSRRDGTYTLPIKAQVGPWEVVYTQLQMTLRNGGTAPIFVPGGIYVDQAVPPTTTGSAAPAPAPTLNITNNVILTGGSTTVKIDWANHPNKNDIIGVVIGVDGLIGHYQVPIDQTENKTALEVKLRMRSYADYETPPSNVPLRIGLRDVRGRITTYAAHLFNVTKVGSGDIQVSLNWDTPTDVDLHVTDPFGCELYYGNKSDAGFGFNSVCRGAGGTLDLDSNAGCYLDTGYTAQGGIRNENVFWPPGAAPEGQYTVKVDYWSACSVTARTNYTVTVNYCGKTEVYEGNFTQGQASGGGAGSGRFVARFDNRQCSRTAVGRVRYQDRTFDRTGFGAAQWKQLEGVVVELRRLQTNEVIGTGVTDRDGNYAIPFPADIPGFVVAVKAMSDPNEGLRDIKVYDHPKFKKLYEVTSAPIILLPNVTIVTQNVDISTEQKSGAFNVFDVLRKGYDLVRLSNGRVLGELRGFWATGSDTTDTMYCSELLYNLGVCTEVRSVSVQGKDTDRDEFDDMVILKEFFKFALSIVARDSHPGDNVTGLRDDARRSWTEGVAHFFASDVLGSRYFVNSRPYGVYIVDDLEGMPSPYAHHVKDGKLSYYLVAAALWDLADSNNEDWDPVDRMRNAVYDTLFSYFPSGNYEDRGAVGVDLSDFLDGWFCRGWGEEDHVRDLIVDYYDYAYDFSGPTDCPE